MREKERGQRSVRGEKKIKQISLAKWSHITFTFFYNAKMTNKFSTDKD